MEQVDTKRLIKRGLERLIAGTAWQQWCFPHQSILVLMYHRVLPDSHPELGTMQPGMVVKKDTFALHLEILKEHFQLVHLGEWLTLVQKGKRLPRRACAVTFDDGWRDTYETAFPLLMKYQVPATVFLVAEYISTNKRFWPERLAVALKRIAANDPEFSSRPEFGWLRQIRTLKFSAEPTLEEIDAAIGAAKYLTDPEIEERIAAMEQAAGVDEAQYTPAIMTWTEIRKMAGTGLVDFGSHTCTHRRLTSATAESDLYHEIVQSRNRLEQELGSGVELFCYPNGDTTEMAERMVRATYRAACSTRRGWNNGTSDPHRLRRIALHDDVSRDYHSLMARLSGWI